VINTVPKEKLLLLDKLVPGVEGDYGADYESFEKDIYSALKQAIQELSKYDTLKLIFPSHSYFPKEIIEGFKKFCLEYGFPHTVIENAAHMPIVKVRFISH
jgi:hypothetical protein